MPYIFLGACIIGMAIQFFLFFNAEDLESKVNILSCISVTLFSMILIRGMKE